MLSIYCDLEKYKNYYDSSEKTGWIKPHRVLAINRGEKEGIINVSLEYNKEYILSYLEGKIIKNEESECAELVRDAILDSFKRLIAPSIEREIRSELTDKSEEAAIDVFSKNLEKYLLTPPMKDKMVLGLDPAYRTGCKLAVIDETGQMLDIKVIYPHEPKNEYEKKNALIRSCKLLQETAKKYRAADRVINNHNILSNRYNFDKIVVKTYNRYK